MDEKQTTAMTTDIRALIADDGYAASFQSMGQYRTALLAALRAQDDAAPVAWITKEQLEQIEEWTADAWVYWRESGHVAEPDEVPLFLHPSLPAAQGLSDDEITQVWLDHGGSLNGNNFRSFARAILSRAATAGAGAENGSTAAQSQARSQSTLVPNGAATVAEPSEEDASYKRMFEDAVRSLAAIDEALGIDPDESGGAAPILEAIAALKKQAAQQQTNQGASHEWDASGERCLKCGDKDWFAGSTCSGKAAQQQAEPSEKLEAPAQVGSTVFRTGVEKRLVVEAAQRLYQFRHNPTEEEKRIADASASIARLRAHLAEKESNDD